MGRSAIGYSPGHISGFFRPVCKTSLDVSGSIGAGIVIAEGVRSYVSPSDETRILVHSMEGKETVTEEGSPPLEYVMRKLSVTADVTTSCRLPIGSGYGLSAAAILATV
ncbi:MAG TPA: GHMP kinase, partial [Methanomicrobiales archaeon]|nr:GHMP kinase [Methanomicrobiales archaeon]